MVSEYAKDRVVEMMEVDTYEEVSIDLRDRIERVCSLVEKACHRGGSLESRQVLATIVEQWEREEEIKNTVTTFTRTVHGGPQD